MAAVDLDTQQVYGGSLPVSAAGRFCLSHSSQCGSHQSQQHSGQQEPQALDHRSHSFPLDMRGASHLSVNPADWVEAPQPQTSRQSIHKEACPPPPSHVKSACQLYDSPKSAWRQSLQQFDQAGSLDSAASEMTTGRKRQTVLVWDLDETLILFHSLLSGAYAAHHSPEKANEAMSMGKKWQESILDICDQHFFFTEVENFDQTTSTALQQWDDHEDLSSYDFDADRMQAPDNDDDKRKLAYRFRRIAQLYGQGIKPLAKNSLEASNWNWLYNATDKLTKGWLTHGARLLQQVTASAKSGADVGDMLQRNASGSSTSSWQSACGDAFGHSMMDQQLSKLMQKTSGGPSNWMDTDDNADVVNVLVTTGQLVPTLGKLLLFRLDGAFKSTSVYSARNEGKAHCFDLIAERFGSDCNYVAIGDGAEEQRCAEQRASVVSLDGTAGVKQEAVRAKRQELKVEPSFKRVDTCAAEFEAATPYMYSSYDGECESMPTDKPKVLILGGGPNRIGQGIEFDYCCCHASFALRADGYETIMMNSNPETVSTDYDTSSRLYFEPLTIEDVLNVIEKERPEGIIIQFGGQTPLKLANAIQKSLEDNPLPAASGKGNVKIWGTQPKSIDDAEDRDKWYEILSKLDMKQPPGGMCTDEASALNQSKKLGFPVMVRPSFVLGGRAMEIVYSETDLKRYIQNAVEVDPERPVLVDKYMDRADELDVDALCDKDGNVTICGIMQHIEQAGVHSGDSACSIPPQTIPAECLEVIRDWTTKLAKELKVVGLINIQYCIQDNQVYIIEANPRASRTVPFVAKAIGHPIAKYASLLMSGKTLAELKFTEEPKLNHVAVKEAVLPFDKFPGADTLLGPEMRSTGEVMGIDSDFSKAYAKAALAAGQKLPASGNVFVSMTDKYKEAIVPIAKELKELGYSILSTGGTGKHLKANGVDCEVVLKIQEGRPNIGDLVKNGDIAMMLITSTGKEVDVIDGKNLRRLALAYKVPIITTVAGAKATTSALAGMKKGPLHQVPLQDYFPEAAERSTVEFKIVG